MGRSGLGSALSGPTVRSLHLWGIIAVSFIRVGPDGVIRRGRKAEKAKRLWSWGEVWVVHERRRHRTWTRRLGVVQKRREEEKAER